MIQPVIPSIRTNRFGITLYVSMQSITTINSAPRKKRGKIFELINGVTAPNKENTAKIQSGTPQKIIRRTPSSRSGGLCFFIYYNNKHPQRPRRLSPGYIPRFMPFQQGLILLVSAPTTR
jgi:hypothetical protein